MANHQCCLIAITIIMSECSELPKPFFTWFSIKAQNNVILPFEQKKNVDAILDSGSHNPNPSCPEITLALPLQCMQYLAPSHHFCRYPNLAWTPNGPYSLFCLPTFHLFLIESELFPCSKAQNPPVVPSSLQGRASMLTLACRYQHSDLILSLNLPRVTFLSFCSSPTGLFIVVAQIAPSSGRVRASQVALMVKNMPANAGDVRDEGLIPGSGRSPGGWHGNLLQYSCLENLMDRGAWWATVHRLQRVGYDWSAVTGHLQWLFLLLVTLLLQVSSRPIPSFLSNVCSGIRH